MTAEFLTVSIRQRAPPKPRAVPGDAIFSHFSIQGEFPDPKPFWPLFISTCCAPRYRGNTSWGAPIDNGGQSHELLHEHVSDLVFFLLIKFSFSKIFLPFCVLLTMALDP